MNRKINIDIHGERIAEFCKRYHIRKLSFFGSVLRRDFRPDSDIDVLMEFESGQSPGFLGLAHIERELSEILEGRKVDIRTPQELSRYFRNEVISSAIIQYAEG
ncbi:MAG: nucleotidyltransferase domain-containing protein [Nitrospinae bacterium]|nr:nucleotidyltransferase domain-containing protein [Nitrospinota bacterium]